MKVSMFATKVKRLSMLSVGMFANKFLGYDLMDLVKVAASTALLRWTESRRTSSRSGICKMHCDSYSIN